MNRIFVALASILLVVSIAGCAGVTYKLKCRGGPLESNRYCEIEAEWPTSSGTFNGSKLEVDASDSNALITTSIVSVTVEVVENGITIDTDSFLFTKIGMTFKPSNPSSLSSFVNSYGTVADEFIISTSSVLADPISPGTTTVVTELIYDGDVIDGDSDSWYVTEREFYDDHPDPGGT